MNRIFARRVLPAVLFLLAFAPRAFADDATGVMLAKGLCTKPGGSTFKLSGDLLSNWQNSQFLGSYDEGPLGYRFSKSAGNNNGICVFAITPGSLCNRSDVTKNGDTLTLATATRPCLP